MPWCHGHPGGGDDARHELTDGPGFAVGNDKRATAQPGSSINRGDKRVRGVVDISSVYKRRTRANESELSASSPVNDPPDQLGVAWTPDEVRTDRQDRHHIRRGAESNELGHGLAGGVVAPCRSRVGGL